MQHSSYIAGDLFSPADMMQRDGDFISPGVLTTSDLVVSAGSSLTVNVTGAAQGSAGGNAWLPGGYRFYNDAAATVTLSAANATYGRIDLIVAGVDTTQTPYAPTITSVTGTPAASPVAPSMPVTFVGIILAQVAVAANATTLTAGNITDVRTIAKMIADTKFPTAGGTGTAIALALATLVDGYSVTFVASAANSAAATTINGKPAYKPNTTTAPNFVAGKAYTIWYNASGSNFFVKASAEGTALAADVLAGYTFSNDSDTGIAGTLVAYPVGSTLTDYNTTITHQACSQAALLNNNSVSSVSTSGVYITTTYSFWADNNNGKVYCFNSSDMSLKWMITTVSGPNPIYFDGTYVYVAGYTYIYKLNIADGSQVWVSPALSHPGHQSIWADSQGVYVGSNYGSTGNTAILNQSTGAVVAYVGIYDSIQYICGDSTGVYMCDAATGGYVYKINHTTGAIIWTSVAMNYPQHLQLDSAGNLLVCYGSGTYYLVKLNLSTGAIIYSHTLAYSYTSFASDGTHIFIAYTSGNYCLLVLNCSDCSLFYQYPYTLLGNYFGYVDSLYFWIYPQSGSCTITKCYKYNTYTITN